MVEVGRQGDQDFIARLGQRHHREAESLVATGGDGYPGGGDRGVVVGAQRTGQGLAEWEDPLLVGVGRRGRTLGNGGDVIAHRLGRRVGRRGLGDVDQGEVAGGVALPPSDLGDRRVHHPMHYLPDAH